MDFCSSETHVTRSCNVVMVGMCQDSEVQQFNQQNKNKTFYLMSLYTQRTITQDLLYPEKCAILAQG